MTNEKKLLEFPCDFPLKIIGTHSDDFFNDIYAILTSHHPELTEKHIQQKQSDHGNYLSISVTVRAHSQDKLDALYQELTKHPDIKMVL